jgi:hypothetical protein
MQSRATSVKQYLADLPAERRKTLQAVRAVILDNLDDGFEEGMQYGMIGYFVPHRLYPAGYHCDPKQPLPFAALASQKNYCSLYLMCVYGDAEHRRRFERAWAASGKRLNMGKSCVRFKIIDDLALDAIAAAIREVTAKRFIQHCELAVEAAGKKSTKSMSRTTPQKPRSKASPTKTVKKRA